MENFYSQTKIFESETLPCLKTKLFTHFTTFHFNSKHISSNMKNFFFIELSMASTNPSWLAHAFFIKTHETDLILDWKIFVHDLIWFDHETCAFMFQIWDFSSKFQFYTWNWLFDLHDNFINFSIKSSQIFMKRGDHSQNISKFTSYLSDRFKHFQNSNYPLVTLHLP